MEVADLSLFTSGFLKGDTGLGILESQGMSGEGGASLGEGDGEGREVDMMSLSLHLSQEVPGIPGIPGCSGLFLLTNGRDVGLGCGMGSVLASLVVALTFISTKVIVPCVLVMGLVEIFLDGTGELTDDLREVAGDPNAVFRLRLLLRSSTTLSGEGSKTISATLGDSVSLKGRLSMSIYSTRLHLMVFDSVKSHDLSLGLK